MIKMTGSKALIKSFGKFNDNTKRDIEADVLKTAHEVRNRWMAKWRKGPMKALKTGRLVGSIVVEKINETEYDVSTDVEYGPGIEYGTKGMAERPAMRTTHKEFEKKFPKNIKKRIKARKI